MSNFQTVVLIGGPYAGWQVELDRERDSVQMPENLPPQNGPDLRGEPTETIYNRVQFHFGDDAEALHAPMFVPSYVRSGDEGAYCLRNLQQAYIIAKHDGPARQDVE